jgi:hypothetical protein
MLLSRDFLDLRSERPDDLGQTLPPEGPFRVSEDSLLLTAFLQDLPAELRPLLLPGQSLDELPTGSLKIKAPVLNNTEFIFQHEETKNDCTSNGFKFFKFPFSQWIMSCSTEIFSFLLFFQTELHALPYTRIKSRIQ